MSRADFPYRTLLAVLFGGQESGEVCRRSLPIYSSSIERTLDKLSTFIRRCLVSGKVHFGKKPSQTVGPV